MRKYTRKELSFISNHDLDPLIEHSSKLGIKHQVFVAAIVELAEPLIILKKQDKREQLFLIADVLYEVWTEKLNVMIELDNRDALPENKRGFYDNLTNAADELRILVNLHPDRILTWEDVGVALSRYGYF